MFRGGGGRGRGGGGGWRPGGGSGGGGGNFRGGRGGQQGSNNARAQNSNQQQQQQQQPPPQNNQNQKQSNQNTNNQQQQQQQQQQPQQPQQPQQQNSRSSGGGGSFQNPQQQQNRTPQGTPQSKAPTPQTTPKQGTPQQAQKQTPQQQKQTSQQSQDPSNKIQTSTPQGGLPQRDTNKGKAPSITVPPPTPPQNGGSQKPFTPQNKNAAPNTNQKTPQGQQNVQNRPGQTTPSKTPTQSNQQGQPSQQSQQEQNAVGASSYDPNSDNTKLFIATVKQGITDKEFRELFSKFGQLKDIYLNKNKWFGLVTFETHADANSARKHYINSNILKLKWAQSEPKETPLILNQSNQEQTPVKKESSSKCRLFIGNLSPEVTPDNIRKLFEAYGTIMELFVPPGKGFGFVRYETRASAEAAKNALEGEPFANRQLQIRFASQGAVLKVRNLSHFVTNELLHQAFEPFGELERATVFVDERGKSLGEGILEFSRKPVAVAVMRKAQQECLLLTTSPLPVIIEPMEVRDDEDGFSEKMINKQSTGYLKDREKAPRFAEKGTFEYEFAMKWKELLALEKLKKDQVDRELQLEKTRLMEEMDIMRYDYDLDTLRRRLKLLESRQEEFENRKLVAEKNNKAREEELNVMRKTIARRQAEILGYPYEEEDDQLQQHQQLQQQPQQQTMQQGAGPGNPNQQLLSGHPVADAVLGAALVVPTAEQQQPSAAAENFLKQWNSITKGVPSAQDQQGQQQHQGNNKMPPGQQMPPQQTPPQGQRPPPPGNWQEVPLPPSQANKSQPNSNKPAYMSYLGQQANGKRLSDPGPVSKRRRY